MTSSLEAHRHRWFVASSHQVSEGLVVYQRCDCGQWRVTGTPPYPVTYPDLALVDPARQR
ncbi:hypothetical protein E1218_18105 [Kribbella turkmenica]|uniref:Uncharacterized protein n=1 Tax=Kribbella turkmenica TaxID=2530375 RepID=A0A4R4WZI4_9ACTN|nr:hypothetical protein [Kribbella turkmenica]TDD23309.1 hypothetical protein E1218_18105 [Kribbella turkmenica]